MMKLNKKLRGDYKPAPPYFPKFGLHIGCIPALLAEEVVNDDIYPILHVQNNMDRVRGADQLIVADQKQSAYKLTFSS